MTGMTISAGRSSTIAGWSWARKRVCWWWNGPYPYNVLLPTGRSFDVWEAPAYLGRPAAVIPDRVSLPRPHARAAGDVEVAEPGPPRPVDGGRHPVGGRVDARCTERAVSLKKASRGGPVNHFPANAAAVVVR